MFISGWGDGMEEHQHCLLADGEMEWRSTNIVYKWMGRWNGGALTLFISGWGDGMEEH